MRYFKLLLITTLVLSASGCSNKASQLEGRSDANRVSIEICHYSNAEGFSVYYLVTDTLVQVDVNCGQRNCKRKTVYKRGLYQAESDSLFNILQRLRLDTLQMFYTPAKLSLKGLETDIRISGTAFPKKEIHISAVQLPAMDSLYTVIDKLILKKKYRYYDF